MLLYVARVQTTYLTFIFIVFPYLKCWTTYIGTSCNLLIYLYPIVLTLAENDVNHLKEILWRSFVRQFPFYVEMAQVHERFIVRN